MTFNGKKLFIFLKTKPNAICFGLDFVNLIKLIFLFLDFKKLTQLVIKTKLSFYQIDHLNK